MHGQLSYHELRQADNIFLWLCGLRHFLCEGALRHRNTSELYSNSLRAVGPTHAQLCTSVGDRAEWKTGQRNETQGSKQGK